MEKISYLTSIIKLVNEDSNYSFNSYENILNTLIDKYMPLRKVY